MEFNVSAKVDGKWRTFGKVKKNQYNNFSLSFKNSEELRAFLSAQGEWINFSLFPPRDDAAPKPAAPPAKDLDDEIPF